MITLPSSNIQTVAPLEAWNLIMADRQPLLSSAFRLRDVLVLTARDRHLTSVTCIASNGSVISVSSSVPAHSLYGRMYRIPVGGAHRMILETMLRRRRNKL